MGSQHSHSIGASCWDGAQLCQDVILGSALLLGIRGRGKWEFQLISRGGASALAGLLASLWTCMVISRLTMVAAWVQERVQGCLAAFRGQSQTHTLCVGLRARSPTQVAPGEFRVRRAPSMYFRGVATAPGVL
jgi:hypothetical protein